MSKIDDLRKTNPAFNLTMFDILSNAFEKSKYVDLFLRLHKERYHKNIDVEGEFDRYFVENGFGSVLIIADFTHYEKFILYRFLQNWDGDQVKIVNKFKELNERNLIEQNDVSKYKSFSELENQVSIAELRLIDKQLEKQIIKIHEDDRWLMIKPLSWEASKKYGANTKWCTTSQDTEDYFYKYSSNGVLIYIIDKKTGYKVACHNHKDEGLSFWDQKDQRVDSMLTLLTEDIKLMLSRHFIDEKMKPNLDYLPKEEKDVMVQRYERKHEIRILMPQEQVDIPMMDEPEYETETEDIDFNVVNTGTITMTDGVITTTGIDISFSNETNTMYVTPNMSIVRGGDN
jgi:hypothetical protein